jgi:serine/threonine protein kinase
MRFVGETVTLKKFFNRDERLAIWPGHTWGDLLPVARNVAEIFHALHKTSRYIAGDVKGDNILLNFSGPDRGKVTLVDIDSIQVEQKGGGILYCNMGTSEFTPREMMGIDFAVKPVKRKVSSDLFGLGVLLFRLLNWTCVHPFQGGYDGNIDVSVKNGDCCLTRSSLPPDFILRPDLLLGSEILELFLRCFVDGHQAPEKRPSAGEWLTALNNAVKNLQTCPRDHRHVWLRTVPDCPFCNNRNNRGQHTPNTWWPRGAVQPLLPNPMPRNLPPASPARQTGRTLGNPGAARTVPSSPPFPPQPVLAPFSHLRNFLKQLRKDAQTRLSSARAYIASTFMHKKLGLRGAGVGLILIFSAFNAICDNYGNIGFSAHAGNPVLKKESFAAYFTKLPLPFLFRPEAAAAKEHSSPDKSKQDIAQMMKRADELFRSDKFAEARNLYREVYKLKPSAGLLEKIGAAEAFAATDLLESKR